MPREFSRQQRLGNQLLRTLSDLLRQELRDPAVDNVSLTSVDLTRDLSIARVYFSLLDPAADPAPVQAGLERASGFLRGRLGREIRIRHVPELRFRHDDSAEAGQRISDLIGRALQSHKE